MGAWLVAGCGPAVGELDDETSTGAGSTGTVSSTSSGPTDPSAPTTSAQPTTATASSTGGSDVSGGDGSTTFELPEDCDLFAQDCPPGYKCAPYSDNGATWNATMCVPVVDDPAGYGEPCTAQESGVSGLDDCDVGALCFELDPETLMGECVELCGGSPDAPTCEQEDAVCIISSDGTFAPCLPTCDPLGDDCDAGELCVPSSDSFVCTTDANPDAGAVGEACEFINVCDAGLGCFMPTPIACSDTDAAGCCLPYCSLLAPDCPGGLTCQPYYNEGEAPGGYEDLGVCQEPQ